MKKLNKILTIILLLFLILSTTCFAATTTSKDLKLEIVENNVCTINIKNSAIFEKKIIDYNLDQKEITLQMQIKNIAEKPLSGPSEIILVMDTSDSMAREVSTGVTRMDAIKTAANKLATTLLENENVKLGIVTFSTSDKFGTLEDAKLKSTLTSSSEDISKVIESITFDGNGQTNIDAGITLASQNFSETCENKYIILLTDGVPNYSIGKSTLEYSGTTAINTKNTLSKITTEDKINLISVMTGVDSNKPDEKTGMTYKELAEEIFGTSENPNYGKFYYIPDSKIDQTISEDILNDIVNPNDGVLTNVDIYDYFPQEIINNFDFEYVASSNLGTISPSIDLQNNCIVWHIDSLGYGETGIVSYKLKVKENVDTSIVNAILNTNEKVEIKADQLDTPATSTVSPKIRLSGDNTKANTVIPQTGLTSTTYVVPAIVLIICAVIGIRLYFLSKNSK